MLATTAMPAAAWSPFSGTSETAPQAASFSFGQLLGSLFAADPVPVAKTAPQPARSRTADDQASTPAASSAPDVLALLMSIGALRTPPATPPSAAPVAAGRELRPDSTTRASDAGPQPLPHQTRTAAASAPASHSQSNVLLSPARPTAPVPWSAASATPEPVKPEPEIAARAKLQPLRRQTLPVLELQASSLLTPAAIPTHASAPVPSPHATLHGSQSVTPALTHPGWNDAIAQRVLWLAQDSVQSASINLNPPTLGALQVNVQIENQQASVQFVTANTQVQEALQDALPVLRELFAQAGIALGQADVGANPNSAKWTALAARRSKPEEARFGTEPLVSDSTRAPRASSAGYRLVNVFA